MLSISGTQITGIREKPEDPENILVNTGVYRLTPDIFPVLRDHEYLVDAISEVLEGFDSSFQLVKDFWIDIGDLDAFLKADRIERELMPGKISEEAEIHETAVVSEGSRIEDDVKLGPGARVLENSVVKEGAEVSANSVVRDSTVCSNSIVSNAHTEGSVVMRRAVLEPSSVSQNCLLGSGAEIQPSGVSRNRILDFDELVSSD